MTDEGSDADFTDSSHAVYWHSGCNSTTGCIMKILLLYDGSANSAAIFEDLDRAGLPEAAEAVVLTAVDIDERRDPAATTLNAARQVAEQGTRYVLEHFPQWNVRPVAVEAEPPSSILEWAHNWSPDLMIAGPHGRSPLRRIFLGSISLAVAQQAECSVRIVRPGSAGRKGPIHLILGTDGSPSAELAIQEVARRSWPSDTEVHVVAAHDLETSRDEDTLASAGMLRRPQTGQQRLETAAQRAAEELTRAGLKTSMAVPDGDPCHCLLTEAEKHHADAIIVGARGLSRIATLFLGSISNRIVKQAHCTVEIIREH